MLTKQGLNAHNEECRMARHKNSEYREADKAGTEIASTINVFTMHKKNSAKFMSITLET